MNTMILIAVGIFLSCQCKPTNVSGLTPPITAQLACTCTYDTTKQPKIFTCSEIRAALLTVPEALRVPTTSLGGLWLAVDVSCPAGSPSGGITP